MPVPSRAAPLPQRFTSAAPSGRLDPHVVIGLILFAVLGFTLGYAVAGRGAWFGLLVPVAFALITAFASGFDVRLLLVLLLALAVTAVAIIAGALLDRYLSERGQRAQTS